MDIINEKIVKLNNVGRLEDDNVKFKNRIDGYDDCNKDDNNDVGDLTKNFNYLVQLSLPPVHTENSKPSSGMKHL